MGLTIIVVAAADIYMWIFVKDANRKTPSTHYLVMQLHVIGLKLTFAGRHAIEPPVINVSVAGTSTVLKPSTARSATTGSAGFLKRAAFWAHHCASDLWRSDWRGE